MSQGMNRVMLVGNLGADPELRYTDAGKPYLRLRLATSEAWIDKKTNELQERTEWHTVKVWGNRAEALARFLTKGTTIVVDGQLQTHSYEKEGQKHYSTEVMARDVFLTGRRSNAAAAAVAGAVADADDAPLSGPALARPPNGAPPRAESEALAQDIPF